MYQAFTSKNNHQETAFKVEKRGSGRRGIRLPFDSENSECSDRLFMVQHLIFSGFFFN